LVLISWFLMLPPPAFPPVQDASGNYKTNSAAPMSQWRKLNTLESEDACKAQLKLKKTPSSYKCVASDDPALTASAPAAAGAPSTSTVSGAAASHMQ
jgi:hypothetical protein